MKIGIITFQSSLNYGAILQTFALKTFLSMLKNEVFVADYCSDFEYSLFRSAKKEKNIVKKLLRYVICLIYLPQNIKRTEKFSYIRKSLNLDKNFNNNDYDLFICGSDQIWNPKITNGIDSTYFLNFFKGKKIAYAASDGEELTYTNEVKEFLKQFTAISVREKSMIKKIDSLLEKQIANLVCDPVFLLPNNEWKKVAKIPNKKNYILVYKLGENENFDKDIKFFSQKENKEIVEIKYIKGIKNFKLFDKHSIYCISPEEFVGYFLNADFVFTTSFHGTAFSIIMEKPFFSYHIKTRSERIKTLLSECGLDCRYINSLSDFSNNPYNCFSEYSNKLLQIYINNSKQYLINAIQNEESI